MFVVYSPSHVASPCYVTCQAPTHSGPALRTLELNSSDEACCTRGSGHRRRRPTSNHPSRRSSTQPSVEMEYKPAEPSAGWRSCTFRADGHVTTAGAAQCAGDDREGADTIGAWTQSRVRRRSVRPHSIFMITPSKVNNAMLVALGGGALGHPKVYINLVCILRILKLETSLTTMPHLKDKPGARPCGCDALAPIESALSYIPCTSLLLVSLRQLLVCPSVLNLSDSILTFNRTYSPAAFG